MAFVCEKVSDTSTLISELCENRKLCINVAQANEPDPAMFQPNIPIENIRYVLK